MKNILIVGATSAIATACAKLWVVQEANIFLVGRNLKRLQQVSDDLAVRGANVQSYHMDANDYQQHLVMLDTAYKHMEKIDIALVAHGALPDQKLCETNAELMVQEFHNNGLSVLVLLTHLASRIEQQKSGVIAVISSVAGDRGRPSNYVYGSAKAAVNAFCSGLRARLFKSGVHVLTIKPGFVDTPMTQHLALQKILLASVDKVAKDIHKAVEKKQDVLYTPWFWRYLLLIIIHIPNYFFKRKHL